MATVFGMLLGLAVITVLLIFVYFDNRQTGQPRKPVKPANLKEFMIVDDYLAKIMSETTDVVAKGYASSAREQTRKVLNRALES